MECLEEVYASAPELLEGSSTGSLGVVAKSRDFPRSIDADLSWQRAYSFIEGLPLDDPAAHPPRLVVQRVGQDKGTLCVTQVVFAGADHTGRTAPLAHHLLFNLAKMQKEHVAVSSLLLACRDLFCRQWRKGPEWLDPRQFDVPLSGAIHLRAWSEVVSPEVLPLVLATAAQAMLTFGAKRKAVIFGLPPQASFDIHALMGEVLTLVPTKIQTDLTCVSHVVDDSDCPREAAVIFAYPGTSFFERQLGRRDPAAPVVLDMSHLESLPHEVEGVFGSRLADALASNDAGAEAAALVQEWESLGLDEAQPELIDRLFKFRDGLWAVQDRSQLTQLAAEASSLSAALPTCTARIG